MIRLRHDVSVFPETWHLGPSERSRAGARRRDSSPSARRPRGSGDPEFGDPSRGRGGPLSQDLPGAGPPHPRGPDALPRGSGKRFLRAASLRGVPGAPGRRSRCSGHRRLGATLGSLPGAGGGRRGEQSRGGGPPAPSPGRLDSPPRHPSPSPPLPGWRARQPPGPPIGDTAVPPGSRVRAGRRRPSWRSCRGHFVHARALSLRQPRLPLAPRAAPLVARGAAPSSGAAGPASSPPPPPSPAQPTPHHLPSKSPHLSPRPARIRSCAHQTSPPTLLHPLPPPYLAIAYCPFFLGRPQLINSENSASFE